MSFGYFIFGCCLLDVYIYLCLFVSIEYIYFRSSKCPYSSPCQQRNQHAQTTERLRWQIDVNRNIGRYMTMTRVLWILLSIGKKILYKMDMQVINKENKQMISLPERLIISTFRLWNQVKITVYVFLIYIDGYSI